MLLVCPRRRCFVRRQLWFHQNVERGKVAVEGGEGGSKRWSFGFRWDCLNKLSADSRGTWLAFMYIREIRSLRGGEYIEAILALWGVKLTYNIIHFNLHCFFPSWVKLYLKMLIITVLLITKNSFLINKKRNHGENEQQTWIHIQ